MRRTGMRLVPCMMLAFPLILPGGTASDQQPKASKVSNPSGLEVKSIEASRELNSARGAVLVAAAASSPPDSAEIGPLQVNAALPAPSGFVQASNCVAKEGIHYVREKERTLTPILAYDEAGKLVSLEYIIARKALEAGSSWKGLPGVAGRAIDHIDVDFYPGSRKGSSTPYYSIHLYFIDGKEQQQICPKSTAVEPVGRVIRSQ